MVDIYHVYWSTNDGKKIRGIKYLEVQKENNIKYINAGALVTIGNPVTVLAFISVLSINFLLHKVSWVGSLLLLLNLFGSLVW